MTSESDEIQPLPSFVCAECGHIAGERTDFCVHCGAPTAPASAEQPWSVFGIASPYVGRDAALAAAIEAIQHVVNSDRATLVIVTGDAGFGRSRFLDRLNERLVDVLPDVLMPKARVRTDDAHPYAPFAQLLRERFYVPSNAPPPAFLTRLSAGITALLGRERGPEVAERIGTMLGLSDTGRVAGGDSAERAWRRALVDVFRADAAHQPLVLTFDDIDRAGGETRALMRGLVPELSEVPVVFLVTATSLESLSATVGALDAATVKHIPLDRLSDDDIEHLTRAILRRIDALPDAMVQRVIRASKGSPLMAEEAVRILIREGAIDTRGDTWTVDDTRSTSVELPEAVEDLVRARLDLLTDDERTILQRAALVGERFWLGALHALDRHVDFEGIAPLLADDADDRVVQQVNALVRRDILRECPESTVRGEREFAFRHQLEQRLHAEALPEDARALHLRLAQWMQVRSTIEPERFLVAIADHLAAAERPEQAAEFFARAGRLSAERYATERAVACLERAVALTPEADRVRRATILNEFGQLLLRTGRNVEAIDTFTQAAHDGWLVSSRRRVALALLGLGRAHRALGAYDDALQAFEAARQRQETRGDQAGLAEALDDIGRVHWIRGDYEQADANYERALAIRRSLGTPAPLAASLSHTGTLLVHRGRFKDALGRFREALTLRRQENDRQGIADSLNTIGYIFAERGDADSAARIWTEAIEVAQEIGDRSLEAVLLNNLGEAELMRNNLEAADARLRDACRIAESTGERRVVFDAIRNQSILEGRKGNSGLAIEMADEALEMATVLQSRAMEGVALRTIGELRGATVFDDSTETGGATADDAFRRAVDIFRDLKNDAELGKTYHAFGTYLLEQGQLLQGKKHLEMARSIFERLEMRKILAQTEATIHDL